MKLDLTPQDAQTLTTLIDIAIRAQGLQVAAAGVILAERIKRAADEEARANVEVPAKPTLVPAA